MIRPLAWLLLLLLPVAACQTFSQVEIMVPAVSQDPVTNNMVGIPVRLDIKMIEPGTGEIFVNTRALTEMDMQGSARLAVMVAGEITGRDIDDRDFLITLDANSTIIGGPSAGAAMTVAISALLEGLEISKDVMMTGMITLDGAVGVVGGIPEKAQAAHLAGARYFLVPEGQAVSYNSTDYSTVNVTELAFERWNITVVEVSNVREAITWFTGLEFPTREFPTTPVALEHYQNLMRDQSEDEIELANLTISQARDILDLLAPSLTLDMVADLESNLNLSADRLEEAYASYNESKFYVASSMAFQSKIITRTVINTARYFAANASDRDQAMASIWNESSDAIEEAETWVNGTETRGITALEAKALAQSRVMDARESLETSGEYYDLDQLEMAIYEASYAIERAFTSRQWANISRYFREGPLTDPEDLKEIAEGLFADASILATYTDLLYEEVFGLPIEWVVLLIPDYGFIDPYESLEAAQRGIENDLWAMATFEALESEVRSGLAIEFINVLALAENLEVAGEMMDTISNKSRLKARISIEDSREIGVEPVISVSRFEFSDYLVSDGDIGILGEGIAGFRYAASTARLSPSLLNLYRPWLDVPELNGSFLVGDITISGAANDPNADAMTLDISLGNFEMEMSLLPGNFSFEIPDGPIPDGPHVLALNLSDGYLFDYYSAHVVIDNHAPSISVPNVLNDTAYLGPLVPNITVFDQVTAELSIEAVLDGEPYQIGTMVDKGEHILLLSATDEAGWSSELRLRFWIDSDTPQIELKLPTTNGTVLKPPVTPSWVVYDNLTAISGAIWQIDGGQWIPAGELNTTRTSSGWIHWFTTDEPISEGNHVFRIRATDMAGNVGETLISFAVDGTPPEIMVTGVEDGGWYNTSIEPGYVVEDENPGRVVSVLLDGTPFPGGSVVDQGRYNFSILAVDSAGNLGREVVFFTVDLVPPALSVNITDGAAYPRQIHVDVTTADTIDQSPLVSTVLDGANYGGELIPPGRHRFEASTSDLAGNTKAMVIEFIVDTEEPRVTLPVSNGTWYDQPVTLSVSVSDDLDPEPRAVLTLDGSETEIGSTVCDGKHVLKIEVSDHAWNIVRLTVDFHVDSTAPEIEISGVEDGGRYSHSIAPVLTVEDSVDDDPDLILDLDGEPYQEGTAIGDGDHSLIATVRDSAGNEASFAVDFVVDTVLPVLEIDILDGAEYRGSITPSITSTDDRGNSTLSVTLDGKAYEMGTEIGPGRHTIVVEATDIVGNTARRKMVFTVRRRTSLIVAVISIPVVLLLIFIFLGRLRRRSRTYRYNAG